LINPYPTAVTPADSKENSPYSYFRTPPSPFSHNGLKLNAHCMHFKVTSFFSRLIAFFRLFLTASFDIIIPLSPHTEQAEDAALILPVP
jgi:hypothetical protein